jgi:glycerol uptake facilitator-like aquaporin
LLITSLQGIVIWAVLDTANPFVAPASAPWVIGLAYAACVWGFADISISTNLARDLGTRFVAAIFYGREAFTYLNYSWIAILVRVHSPPLPLSPIQHQPRLSFI